MTNYKSIRNLWTSKGFHLGSITFLKCLVSLNFSYVGFHGIHAQHKFMVICHKLNMCDKWACLLSYRGIIIKFFFCHLECVRCIHEINYSTFKVFQTLSLLCETSIFLLGREPIKRLFPAAFSCRRSKSSQR